MSVFKRNVAANFAANIWQVLMGVAFVPLYINLLGMEAYGLVGFFATLQVTLGVLEMGLRATINRELARHAAWPDRPDEVRDLSRSLEIIYWIAGALLAVGIGALAGWLARDWIKTEALPIALVRQSVILMGIGIAFQWPISLYSGGLMGLQRQVLLSAMNSTFTTLRGLGAILIVWKISPVITSFFLWQVMISAVQAAVMAPVFWRALPAGKRRAKFSLSELRKVWRFTFGMGATGSVTFLLSQLDKVVLSKFLTMSMFGVYNLANQVNIMIRMPSNSICAALLPKTTLLCAKEDEDGLRIAIHDACQFLAAIVLPMSATIVFFSHELLYFWTRNSEAARLAAPIASVLALGSALNSLMSIPYDITVARGWAAFGFYQNLVSAIFLVPIMLMLVAWQGGIGAAGAWLALNIGYMTVSAPIIFKRVLPGELRKWYLTDVGRPLAISLVGMGLARLLLPGAHHLWWQMAVIIVAWLVTQLLCAFSVPVLRMKMSQLYSSRKDWCHGVRSAK